MALKAADNAVCLQVAVDWGGGRRGVLFAASNWVWYEFQGRLDWWDCFRHYVLRFMFYGFIILEQSRHIRLLAQIFEYLEINVFGFLKYANYFSIAISGVIESFSIYLMICMVSFNADSERCYKFNAMYQSVFFKAYFHIIAPKHLNRLWVNFVFLKGDDRECFFLWF